MEELGARLRYARMVRKLRLRDVAEKAGCSESYLSKVECSRQIPSLQMLHAIAAAVGTTVAELFSDEDRNEVVIYRAGSRPTMVIDNEGDVGHMELERLAPYAEDRLLYANLHVIEPGAHVGENLRHTGEEVGYVLEGELELWVNNTRHQLGAGDSFFFRSELPHRWRNPGPDVTRVVWVNTPPF